MKNYPLWKATLVILVISLAIIFSLPSLLYKENSNNWFFDNKINFTTTLVTYKANSKWIPAKIKEMKEVLDQEKIPEINSDCEKCIYLNTNKYYIE